VHAVVRLAGLDEQGFGRKAVVHRIELAVEELRKEQIRLVRRFEGVEALRGVVVERKDLIHAGVARLRAALLRGVGELAGRLRLRAAAGEQAR